MQRSLQQAQVEVREKLVDLTRVAKIARPSPTLLHDVRLATRCSSSLTPVGVLRSPGRSESTSLNVPTQAGYCPAWVSLSSETVIAQWSAGGNRPAVSPTSIDRSVLGQFLSRVISLADSTSTEL